MNDPARQTARHFRGPDWVREAVELHEKGLTNVAIGQLLGISDSAVSSQLRRNARRIRPPEWVSALKLEAEFEGAISQGTLLRWARTGGVEARRSGNRWSLYRPGVVEFILARLDRPCADCGVPINSIRSIDRVCTACRDRVGGGASPIDERWAELGKRLRNA
jgi:hypothetical protein